MTKELTQLKYQIRQLTAGHMAMASAIERLQKSEAYRWAKTEQASGTMVPMAILNDVVSARAVAMDILTDSFFTGIFEKETSTPETEV